MQQRDEPRSEDRSLLSRIGEELQPNRLLPGLNAGLVNGILVITIEISFAAMLFTGDLSRFVSRGVGLTLFGAFVLGVVNTLTSSYPGTVSIVQDAPVVVLALIAATIAEGMPASASETDLFYSIVAAITLSTLISGGVFLAMGRFKLGNLIRFVPYPVIGGFLAGIGWLLAKGGIGVMTGEAVSLSQFTHFFQLDLLLKWMPGAVLSVILLLVSMRYRHFLILPSMLIGAIVFFYLILFLTGTTVAQASSQGWLLGPFPEGSLWRPLTPVVFDQVNWNVVFGQISSMGTVFLISVVSILLNASGLELTVRRDIDLNKELKSAGWANLFAGLGGSPTGYMGLSMSALGYKLGSNSRLIGLTAASLCGMTLLFGASAISYFPKPVAGSMLIFVGLDFLYTWLYRGWFKLPKADFFLVFMILLIIGTVGFLEGVALGILVAVTLFILNYSRINVIKYVLTGANYRSRVERAAPFQWILNKEGKQLHILVLQGFVFFGTANNLLNQVSQRVNAPDQPHLRYLIFDFRNVTGFDSSTLNSFEKMKQVAESKGMTLIFTQVSQHFQNQLRKGGFFQDENGVIKFFPDLDHGVEWCEDKILAEQETALKATKDTRQKDRRGEILESTYEDLMKALAQQAEFESLVEDMAGYLEQQDIAQGHFLINQGRPVAGLYFIESGQVTTSLVSEEGKILRLIKMGPGSLVGEQEFYSGFNASVSVFATIPSKIYFLSKENLKRLEASDPDLAARLHRFVAGYLGRRLANLSNTMSAILR